MKSKLDRTAAAIEYPVVYEWAAGNWSAYSPDVPGCIAVGDTRQEVEDSFREALGIWIAEARKDGVPIPEPRSDVGRVRIADAA